MSWVLVVQFGVTLVKLSQIAENQRNLKSFKINAIVLW